MLPADSPEPRAQAPTRSQVLRNRDLRRYLAGFATTMLGTAMTPVALTFAVLDQGGDAGDIGWVLGAQSLALVALLLFGGVVADRLPRQQILVVADLARAVSQGALALLLITGRPALGLMMALAAVLGAGQAFGEPALIGVLPQITPPDHLQPANALVSVAGAVGESLGPAIGGLLVATVGAGWAVGLDAATYAFSAWCIATLPMSHEAREQNTSVLRDLREGWDAFRSRTWLWVVVLQFAVLHLLVLPAFLVVGAVVADEHMGGSRAWGLVTGGFGLGMVVGGLAMFRWRPSRLLLAGVTTLTSLVLPLAALAAAMPAGVVVPTAVATGLGFGVFATAWTTSLQQHVEPESLSRVSSYDWFGSVATLPVGFALVGPISAMLGNGGALWAAAAVWLVASAVVIGVPSVRRLRAVEPSRLQADGPEPAVVAPA